MTLIDTEMAAFMLNSSRRHVQNLVHRGLILNHGKSHAIRIDLGEFDRALTDGKIGILPVRDHIDDTDICENCNERHAGACRIDKPGLRARV